MDPRASMLLIFVCSTVSAKLLAEVHYEWNYVNYTWSSRELYEQALQDYSYARESNAISGTKVWKNRMYLTVPRFKKGVPATLTTIALNDEQGYSPLLSPYPSWKMQNEMDCAAFQSVHGMEIDPKGRMWLVDNGRVEVMTNRPRNICRPRLMILDLENDGEVIYDFAFPREVANPKSTILNDIVLDHEEGGFAYIVDIDDNDPGIVVFSLRDRSAWKVRHWTMFSSEEATNDTEFVKDAPVDGIALSPASADQRYVFYSPLASYKLYAVPTWALKIDIKDIDPYVIEVGEKFSQSRGMVMSAVGDLYSGLFDDDAVAAWNIDNAPFNETQDIVIQDHDLSQYPDSFTIDNTMKLWYVTNGLRAIRTDSFDPSNVNFRIIVAQLKSKSYQYFKDGSTPPAPIIRRSTMVDVMRRLFIDWMMG